MADGQPGYPFHVVNRKDSCRESGPSPLLAVVRRSSIYSSRYSARSCIKLLGADRRRVHRFFVGPMETLPPFFSIEDCSIRMALAVKSICFHWRPKISPRRSPRAIARKHQAWCFNGSLFKSNRKRPVSSLSRMVFSL